MDKSEATDEKLALLVKQGDKDAFGFIMDRYLEKIKRYARKFIFDRDDIDDLVQDVFLKAYSNIQSFNHTRKFSPWIYRIAHNEFINAVKKKIADKILFVDFDTFFPGPEARETSDRATDSEFTAKILDEHLQKLKPKYREVLILHFFEDMDYKEIAEVMAIPVSTVGVRIKRGKEKLKSLLDKKL